MIGDIQYTMKKTVLFLLLACLILTAAAAMAAPSEEGDLPEWMVLREQMRERGLARARVYSWQRTTETILRIYGETAAGR